MILKYPFALFDLFVQGLLMLVGQESEDDPKIHTKGLMQPGMSHPNQLDAANATAVKNHSCKNYFRIIALNIKKL
jgi:hypothetical protein